MLVNVDKTIKDKLLRMLQKEAEDYRITKKASREKKIKEERDYIEQLSRQEPVSISDTYKVERNHKREGNNKSYSNVTLQRLNPYHMNFGRNNKRPYIPQSLPSYLNQQDHPPQLNKSSAQLKRNNSSRDIIAQNNNTNNNNDQLKEKDMIRKEDNMANYLTDILNENKVNEFFINKRNKQISYYKSVLDAQCSQIEQITSIPSCAFIHNPIIIQQYKRNQIAKNPYCKRRNNNIGLSTLEHNIILNPENNLGYNKYLNFVKRPWQENTSIVHNWNNGIDKQIGRNHICDRSTERKSMNGAYSANRMNNIEGYYEYGNKQHNNQNIHNQIKPYPDYYRLNRNRVKSLSLIKSPSFLIQ